MRAFSEFSTPRLILVSAILVIIAALAGARPVHAGNGAVDGAGDGQRRIVISLDERRLYVVEPGVETRSFPVAIGRPGVAIPLGDSAVIRKRRDPTWHPTVEQRRAKPSLPSAVPPGPSNPLGKFALDLGWTAIAIHGTNEPDSVGRRASAGCFRMLPADIETLFETTPLGTPVRVIRDSMQPGAVFPVAAKAPAMSVPPKPVPAAIPASIPAKVPPAAVPSLPDPRCATASAPLRRLICDTPALAALDGRARGLQERFLASLPDRGAAAYAFLDEERRFDDRIAALCWVRRGSESDPSVAAAARACLTNALSGRLDDVAARVGDLYVAGR